MTVTLNRALLGFLGSCGNPFLIPAGTYNAKKVPCPDGSKNPWLDFNGNLMGGPESMWSSFLNTFPGDVIIEE